MAKYLLDTCIWRDFYEDRKSKSGRELGKAANKLVKKILDEKDTILLVESIIWELRTDYHDSEINELLGLFFACGTLKRIKIEHQDREEAERISTTRNLPFVDCLHAVLARNHNAILVSQDKHIVESLKDIAKTARP